LAGKYAISLSQLRKRSVESNWLRCCLHLPADVRQSCLDFAAQHYNAATLLTTPQHTPADVAQQLQKTLAAAAAGHQPTAADAADTLAGIQPDVVIDCVGMQQTVEAAVRAVAPGGKIVLVGMGSEQLLLPATLLTCKEVDLLGSFR
jgi:L-iditol 2-dehydrogenase